MSGNKFYQIPNLIQVNEIPVEERAVMADNPRPVLRQLMLLLVMPQAVFPWGREFTPGALVVLQNSSDNLLLIQNRFCGYLQ